MSLYFLIFSLLSYLAGVATNLLYDVHMLQLNSYRNERYRSWMQQQRLRSVHIGPLLSLGAFVLWPLLGVEVATVFWSGLFLSLFLTRNQTQQKKKLVITKRVSRLLLTLSLLIIGIALCLRLIANSLGLSADLVFLSSLSLLGFYSPLLLCLSNRLNQPLETAIARYYYNDAKRILSSHTQLTRIGITGSFGKTSTKFILQQCLARRYHSLATPESYNTTMGVILVIRNLLRPVHEFFIAEMGARQPGDIREICDLVSPQAAIITAVGEQHLETFKDVNTILSTKLELFASLPAGGLACYNSDQTLLHGADKPMGPRYVSYAIDNMAADYRALDLQINAKGTAFTLQTPSGESQHFHTRLVGRHNIYNILAAVTVSVEYGIPLAELVPVIASLKPTPHRLEVKQTSGNFTILDNAFSSNPQGAKSALEVLAAINGRRKILITPGMVELGSKEFDLNKTFGSQAAQVCDHVILVGAKRAVPIQQGLLEAGFAAENIYIAADLTDGQTHLNGMVQAEDVVLYENDLPDTYNEVKA